MEVWEVQESTCLKKPLKMELLAPPGGLIALRFGASSSELGKKDGFQDGFQDGSAPQPTVTLHHCR